MSSLPVQLVIAALHSHGCDPKPQGKGHNAKCPCHDDRKSSLSINEGDDGKVLIYCHAGCGTNDIVTKIDLTMADLMPVTLPPLKSRKPVQKQIVATYPYHDENGDIVYEVVRYEPKDFSQRRPNGKGDYIWNLTGVQRILYRLLELVAAGEESFIFIVEGEKDADRLVKKGLIATTCPQGAGNWSKVNDTPLHGRHVIIIADNDAAGRKHVNQVAAALDGKAKSVRVLHLPGLPVKGDVSNWFDAGGDAESLMALAEQTEEWTQGDEPVDDEHKDGNEGFADQPSRRAKIVRLSDVQPQSVEWLWDERIALGKLTLIAGDPGLGKSFVTLDIAARVSTGLGFPDAPGRRFEPASVVLLSAEDDVADTIRPRLDAAGADVTRIVVLQGVMRTDPDSGDEIDSTFCLTTDLFALEEAITSTPDCRLVVIDPITAYLGKTDSHKNADIRSVLAPLSDLAARHGVAVVAVTHLNKGGGGPAIYRAMGSLAFVAAARAAWCVIKDKGDQTRRFMLPIKNNIAPDVSGLAYTIQSVGSTAGVVWETEPVTMSADDAMGLDHKDNTDGRPAFADAVDWLKDALGDGPVEACILQAMVKQAGHSWGTVKRAKDDAGAESYKQGFGENGKWWWRLKPLSGAAPPEPEPLRSLGEVAPLSDNDAENERPDDVKDEHDSKGAQPSSAGRLGERDSVAGNVSPSSQPRQGTMWFDH